jgi:DNA-binding transcriptional LysR family regulator
MLALKGKGIALEPSFIIDDDLKAGRLIPLLRTYEAEETPIHAVYPHSRLLSAKVRTFVDFLAAQFSEPPAWDRRPDAAHLESRPATQRLRVVA